MQKGCHPFCFHNECVHVYLTKRVLCVCECVYARNWDNVNNLKSSFLSRAVLVNSIHLKKVLLSYQN